MTMFHPSVFGHEQLALEAHQCVAARIDELARRAPPPRAFASDRIYLRFKVMINSS